MSSSSSPFPPIRKWKEIHGSRHKGPPLPPRPLLPSQGNEKIPIQGSLVLYSPLLWRWNKINGCLDTDLLLHLLLLFSPYKEMKGNERIPIVGISSVLRPTQKNERNWRDPCTGISSSTPHPFKEMKGFVLNTKAKVEQPITATRRVEANAISWFIEIIT